MKKILFLAYVLMAAMTASAQESIQWIDPLEAGAEVYGHGWKELRNTYHRLPDKAEGVVPGSVWRLSRNSAGLNLVFRSDAPTIWVRYQVTGGKSMFHMPSTGVSGVDMYAADARGGWHFVSPLFAPSMQDTIKYVFPRLQTPGTGETGVPTTYRLSLPLYNGVAWMQIGVPEGCQVDFVPVPDDKPIVIYGSSITQGGCCSRPSMAWPTIVSTDLRREVVNLGFSGSGKGEKEVFDLIAEIDAEVLVVDCLPNMDLTLPIKDRIVYGVRKYRETHDCPILLAEYSVCGQEGAVSAIYKEEADAKNAILREAYLQLRKEGVKRLYYLAADEWDGGMDGYVEGLHPNDFGMKNLAAGMTKKLRKILRRR